MAKKSNIKYVNFYNICNSRELLDVENEVTIERIKVLAEQNDIDIKTKEDIINAFNVAKEELNAIEKAKKDAAKVKREATIAKKRKEIEANEKALEAKLLMYSGLYGRDKLLSYLKDQYDIECAIIENSKKNNSSNMSAGDTAYYVFNALADSIDPVYRQKKDWAIAGGIADGLAGPAAGVATALNIQRENAVIDAQNRVAGAAAEMKRQELRAQADYYKNLLDKSEKKERKQIDVSENKERCKLLTKQIAAAKEKLVKDIDAEILLSLLAIKVESIDKLKSGSLQVNIETSKCIVEMYEKVAGVIDGEFKAIVWDSKGNAIGIAKFVLPYYGSCQKSHLVGICMNPKKYSGDLYIDFINPSLWVIEADEDISVTEVNKININEYEDVISESSKLRNYCNACETLEIIHSDFSNLDSIGHAISELNTLGDYRKSKEKSEFYSALIYEKAMAAKKGRNFDLCIKYLQTIPDYKDSKKLVKSITKKRKTMVVSIVLAIILIVSLFITYIEFWKPYNSYLNNFSDVASGDILTFGLEDNRKTEWIVLGFTESGNVVLALNDALSYYEYGCDYKNQYTGSNWEKSECRKMLNGRFYNSHFTLYEKSLICTAVVENKTGSTEDKVYLLNASAYRKYQRSGVDIIKTSTSRHCYCEALRDEHIKCNKDTYSHYYYIHPIIIVTMQK